MVWINFFADYLFFAAQIGQFATHLTHHSIGRDIVLYPTMFSKKHKQTLSTELKFDGFQNDLRELSAGKLQAEVIETKETIIAIK